MHDCWMCAHSGKFLEGFVHSKMNKSHSCSDTPAKWMEPFTLMFVSSLHILFFSIIVYCLQIVLWSFDWRTCLMHSSLKKKKKKSRSYHRHHKVDFHITERKWWAETNSGFFTVLQVQPYRVWELCSSEQCRGQQHRMWQEFTLDM